MENELREKQVQLQKYMDTKVIGQSRLNEALMITVLCDGHLLIEGKPGLAKTRAVQTFSSCISCRFGRIQFTPDMLPTDITGSEIYDPAHLTFKFQEGPLFANIILADEINRAPAKVQSALLEAMPESIIVFTTAYDEYAVRAFTVNSIDYLLKPIHEERLRETIQKYEKMILRQESGRGSRELLSAIMSLKNADKKYLTLNQLTEQLDPDKFFRANRQTIVNVNAITKIEPYDMNKILVRTRPASPEPIIVSREKASSFKLWLDFSKESFPVVLRYPHEMFRREDSGRCRLAGPRVVETEAAFVHHAAGFIVSVIIYAPYGADTQVCKAPMQKTADGFRYQPLSPIRLAYPVADFRLVSPDPRDIRVFPEQQTYASDRFAGFLQDNCVCLRSGKDRADHLKTVFNRCVRRPSRHRAYFRVFGIFIQCLCI